MCRLLKWDLSSENLVATRSNPIKHLSHAQSYWTASAHQIRFEWILSSDLIGSVRIGGCFVLVYDRLPRLWMWFVSICGVSNISSTTCLLVHVVTPSTDTIMPKPSINSIFGIFSISNWVNFNICALHRQLMNECRKNLQFIALDAHFQFALIQIQIQRIQNTVSHLYVVLLGMNWIRVVRFQRWKIFQENSFDHFFLICSIFLWNFFPSYCQWWQLASSRLEANNAAKTK